jgi:DNA-binding MarR family transcriptional regulator
VVDQSADTSSSNDPSELVASVFNSLRRLVNAMHSASRETQHSQGVTAAQLYVLSHVRRSPNLSIGALAELTMTHQSTVSVVVRRLVRRKLLQKRRAADDARRVELTLTSAGRTVVETAPEAFQLRLLRVLGSLDEGDQAALSGALSRLVAGIGAEDAPAGMFFESVEP